MVKCEKLSFTFWIGVLHAFMRGMFMKLVKNNKLMYVNIHSITDLLLPKYR